MNARNVKASDVLHKLGELAEQRLLMEERVGGVPLGPNRTFDSIEQVLGDLEKRVGDRRTALESLNEKIKAHPYYGIGFGD